LNAPADVDVAITGWLQSVVPSTARPILDAASFLGGTPGWLLLIGLAFWWSGSRVGVRVALVASISAVFNLLLKWALAQPRPYFLSDRITPLEASDGFGMPSGHAQGSVAAWGSVAYWSRARWVWVVGGLAVLLSGLARVYYGVHSVLQVAVGWLLGAAVIAAVAGVWPRVARRWRTAGRATRCLMVALPWVLALSAILLLRLGVHRGFEVPVAWVERHQAASTRLDPGSTTADLRLFDTTTVLRWTGGLLGASLLAAWYGSGSRRDYAPATNRERAANTLIGLAATAIVLGVGEPLVRLWGGAADFVRFAVLLWTIGVVVPRAGEKLSSFL
jgi:membrane-associated phospholipid phosphatase